MRLPKTPRRPGAALVELAILLPLLAFLFVAGVDFARVFYHSQAVMGAARNGAVYGALDDTHSTDTAGIQSAALADAKDLNPAPTIDSTTGTDAAGYPCVRVTATWKFGTLTRFPGVPASVTLVRTVEARIAPTIPKNSTF